MEQHSSNDHKQETAFSEKRFEHRRRVLKTGTILFNKGYASYGCQVRNLNDRGAMVEMGETTGIPHEFQFRMDGVNSVPASIVWRTSSRMGLKFHS